MENNTNHRPIMELIDELLQHPELVRLEWITKEGVREECKNWTDNYDDEKFEKFWENNHKELKENSYKMFDYDSDYLNGFFEKDFVQ